MIDNIPEELRDKLKGKEKGIKQLTNKEMEKMLEKEGKNYE